ncbi:MAG TPA: hypothetical protein VHV08_03830 [Pirellulales bacterium]|jgi:hypothetical protein|nr:hypothetical protein [Pirellulales bacterium]
MSDTFNGYHVWLGIPPSEQPPNHYRLLGIAMYEADMDVIDHASDRQMAHVRTFQSGRHGALSQQILNELAAARLCLLNSEKKIAYDEQLRAKLEGGMKVVPIPIGRAVPIARAIPDPAPRPQAAPMPRSPMPSSAMPSAATPARAAVTPVVPDVIPLDISNAADFHSAESFQIRIKRRRYKRNSNWQNAAIVGMLAGVAVIVCFVLYIVLRDLDWASLLQETPFAPSAPVESTSVPGALPPGALPVSPGSAPG